MEIMLDLTVCKAEDFFSANIRLLILSEVKRCSRKSKMLTNDETKSITFDSSCNFARDICRVFSVPLLYMGSFVISPLPSENACCEIIYNYSTTSIIRIHANPKSR